MMLIAILIVTCGLVAMLGPAYLIAKKGDSIKSKDPEVFKKQILPRMGKFKLQDVLYFVLFYFALSLAASLLTAFLPFNIFNTKMSGNLVLNLAIMCGIFLFTIGLSYISIFLYDRCLDISRKFTNALTIFILATIFANSDSNILGLIKSLM